jgi:outer membrane protein OmpA-like peptidoglycan-associated protein
MKTAFRSRRPRIAPTQHESEQQAPFFSKSYEPEASDSKTPFFNKTNPIQAKLAIGQPGDVYEREADSVADAVVNHSNQTPVIQQQKISSIQRLATPIEEEKMGTNDERMKEDKLVQEKQEEEEPVQMQAAPEEEEPVQMQAAQEEEEPIQKAAAPEEEEPVQMQAAPEEEEPIQKMEAPKEEEEPAPAVQPKSDGKTNTASSHLSSRIESSKGKGAPLPANTRAEMESSFGTDFHDVRIHNDGEAVNMNKELGAHAFTTGQDIYFNQGKYSPESTEGKRLLAHELTHTVQQGGGAIQKDENNEPPALKEHGDVNQIPDGVKSSCQIGTSSPSSQQPVKYSHNSSALNPVTRAILNQFVVDWHARGAKDNVRIDGYASTEGPEQLNWQLSCSRASTIKRGLQNPSNGLAGIPESFIQIFAHGETNQFDRSTLSPNRLGTITSSVPVTPDPPTPKPTTKTKEFIVTVKSFIAPIGMKTGFILCPGTSDPLSIKANRNLRLLGIATDLAFSENPTSDAMDKAYRLFSSRKFTVHHNDTTISSIDISPIVTDTGKEGPLQPPPLTITNDTNVRTSPTSLDFAWAGKGRPHLAAEPTFQAVCPRLSVFIWHSVRGQIKLDNGEPTITTLALLDSKFPSDKVFINGDVKITSPQGEFKLLWRSSSIDPLLVG